MLWRSFATTSADFKLPWVLVAIVGVLLLYNHSFCTLALCSYCKYKKQTPFLPNILLQHCSFGRGRVLIFFVGNYEIVEHSHGKTHWPRHWRIGVFSLERQWYESRFRYIKSYRWVCKKMVWPDWWNVPSLPKVSKENCVHIPKYCRILSTIYP